MLRIHLTGEDLVRVRVATSPEYGTEWACSLWVLTGWPGGAVLAGWRRRARGRLDRRTRMLFDLVAPDYFPDFLGPIDGSAEPAEAVETIRSTGRRQLHHDLTDLAAHRPLTAAVRRLGTADPQTMRELGDAVDAYHRSTIAEYWPWVRDMVAADRGRLARALLDGGVDRLLATLHPRIRWRPPVLTVSLRGGEETDLRPGGRGLLVVPSVFAGGWPVVYPGPDSQPILVYPVEVTAPRLASPDAVHRQLGALLGRTRAAVLAEIAAATGCTTSELARRLDISLATASTHATVLREAGLISTRRIGSAVLHTVTTVGASLLDAPTVGG
jgi:DNA-binding transcriptional ArsR family regulator